MKKIIPFVLALSLLTGCSGGAPTLQISSDTQRLLETARTNEQGVSFARFEKQEHLAADPIQNVSGCTLEIDADVQLPDTDHVPIASVKTRKLTQEDADRILDTFIGDRDFVCEDGVTPANRLLKDGIIRGKAIIPVTRYSQKELCLQITEDGAAFFQEPYGSFDTFEMGDFMFHDVYNAELEKYFPALEEQPYADKIVNSLKLENAKAHSSRRGAFLGKATRPTQPGEVPRGEVYTDSKGGILVEYYPTVERVPITYISQSSLLEWDDTQKQQSAERITIGYGAPMVSGVGVKPNTETLWFQWQNPFGEFEILERDAKLLPMPEIMEIFRMVVKSQTYHFQEMFYLQQINRLTVTKIQLNEMYLPNEDGSGGLLVPVWDFTVRIEAKTNLNYDAGLDRILLTVNAVDGTIMNRSAA